MIFTLLFDGDVGRVDELRSNPSCATPAVHLPNYYLPRRILIHGTRYRGRPLAHAAQIRSLRAVVPPALCSILHTDFRERPF